MPSRTGQAVLRGALRQSAGAVATTQQAMSAFMQRDVVRRCVAGHPQRGTDLADLIARDGTIYLLGKE